MHLLLLFTIFFFKMSSYGDVCGSHRSQVDVKAF